MIPKFSHIIEQGRFSCFVTTDAVVGACVRVPLVDVEAESTDEQVQRLRRWLKSLPSEVLVRLSLRSKAVNDPVGKGFRSGAVGEIGWTKSEMLISIEARGEAKLISDIKRAVGFETLGIERRVSGVVSALVDLQSAVAGVAPLSADETKRLFFWETGRGFRVCPSYLDFGHEVLGVLRLQRQAPGLLDDHVLASALKHVPHPFELNVSLRRLDQIRREFTVRTRLKQESSGSDRISRAKADATEDVLENTFLQGAELFEFEFLVTVRASCEEDLRKRFKEVEERLSGIGDIRAESFGCLPSWIATMPGANQHVPLLEMDEALMVYLPLASEGEVEVDLAPVQRAMLVHRKDASLMALDLFSSSAINANAVIVGASGKGKSVLTGLLTSSLLADPQTRVIKVDVGGSHSRECELFGGREFSMSLDRPSGINPFAFAQGNDCEGLRAILGKFIEVLVLEDGEGTLPKAVRVEIDDLLSDYLGSSAARSLDGFFQQSTTFSRRALLSRWCGKGLYCKAFSEYECDPGGDARLRYFNFSQIFQAGDPDFSQAGMAAVLAQFNLELLKNPESRLVLICDETPFFIERCFEFFKFSMANVRKFGASIVLVVQLSQHLIKRGDTGLLENAFHRFLFSADGDPEHFIKRFGADTRLTEKIRDLGSAPGKMSEVVYQYGGETRTLVLKLTSQEFWRVTSSQRDRIKVQKLREAVPELSLEEALSCLARIG